MNYKKYSIVCLVIISCIIMGFVDAVIQPGYVIKSSIKISLFLAMPILYAYFNSDCDLKSLMIPQKTGTIVALLIGTEIYILIVSAYFLLKDVFDFSTVATSLSSDVGVNGTNFIWVSLYISFVNSLLEEFFFRGFAFLVLQKVCSRRFAYIFSALTFALYHIAIMIGWVGIELIALAVIGLVIGGLIFNFCNEKTGNIYISWVVHMFANFGINTIGFILFDII